MWTIFVGVGKKNSHDELFEAMNSYHPDIKFKLNPNANSLLDTEILRNDAECATRVFQKKNKFPTVWSLVRVFPRPFRHGGDS